MIFTSVSSILPSARHNSTASLRKSVDMVCFSFSSNDTKRVFVCSVGLISFGPGGNVLLQPGKNLLMPELTVARLQDPVAFVGKVDEPRRHPLALETGEQLDAFADRDAEIEVVVDNEHGGLEFAKVGGQAMGRIFFV